MSKSKVGSHDVQREALMRKLREVITEHPYLGEALHRAASGDTTPVVSSGTDSGWATGASYENQGNRWHG